METEYTDRQVALLRVMGAIGQELTPFGEQCMQDGVILNWAKDVVDWHKSVNSDGPKFISPNDVPPPPEGIVWGVNACGTVDILQVNGPARMRRLMARYK